TAFRHTTEGTLAYFIRAFRSLTHEAHYPLAVYLPWARPSSTDEYQRIFQAALYFESEEISMVLEKDHVEASVITANYDLLRILVAHAEEKSAQIQQDKGFAARIKESLLHMGQKRLPSVEEMAAHLHTSPRTLQRRLQVEGYSYKKLTDELRKEMALSYLKRPELRIGEIAFLLDYADASAFIRTFKRWTGLTPKAYRAYES
ncbi:MAG: helix-turn-helix domain-containing protein, partial [Bacteroidota bacterium]